MTRAANLESSIHQAPDGRWHGYVTVGTRTDGTRDRRHVSGAKRADVVRKVRELERQRNDGTVGPAGRAITLGDWMRTWLESVAVRRVRPKTWEGYESYIRCHIEPGLGHHRLDKLQPEHLEAYYSRKLAEGLSPSTVLHHHRVISRALKVAQQRGRVQRNVATLVDAPSAPRSEVQPFDREEARLLLAAAEDRPNGARWTVALALGLRQGEALGLRWVDIDFEAKTLAVRQALQRQKIRHGCGAHPADDVCGQPAKKCPQRIGGSVITAPKSRAGMRTIALPQQLVDRLKKQRAEQLEARLAAGEYWHDNGLVFVDELGRAIDPRRDWADWKRLLKAAGLRDARLHDARHTAATLLLQQGASPRVVMEVLGHSQIGLTQNTYQHVVPEIARDAADKIAKALWE